MLVHLPGDHTAATVRDGLLATIKTLPEHLRKSLTWDQGSELSKHREITLATKMDIYFCDPHSPWQRGSNENTNGLLRQYFPKGTDLSVHSAKRLIEVATELNGRPRKTLGGITPAQAMQRLLFDPEESPSLRRPRELASQKWDFNNEPGLVCDRPRPIILARSPASLRSIVAALIATSKAASASVRSSSPSRRRIGTRTSSIGARRLPTGARRTAQHLTNATMISGPYVGPRLRRGLTTFSFDASRSVERA